MSMLCGSYDDIFIAEVGMCRVRWDGIWVECSRSRPDFSDSLMPNPSWWVHTFGESQSRNQG